LNPINPSSDKISHIMNIHFYKAKLLCLPAILVILFFNASIANAQSYKWVKGGGSTSNLAPLGGDRSEQVKYMCTDDNGNVYIVAHMGMYNILADTFYRAAARNITTTIHNFIASYDCNGVLRWAKMLEGYGGIAEAGGIDYYNGNIYFGGALQSDMLHPKYIGLDTVITNTNYSSYLAKFDTGNGGDLKWVKFIGSNVSGNQWLAYAGKIAVDGQGYVHNIAPIKRGCIVTPTFTTTQAGTYDLKYDTAGNLLSVSQITTLDSVWAITQALYNKQTGKWYATIGPSEIFWYSVMGPANNTAVCVFRPDNSLVWMDTTGNWGYLNGLKYDGIGNLYIAGSGQGPGSSYNVGGITVNNTIGNAYVTIFKIDTNDNGKWAYTAMNNLSACNLFDLTLLPDNKIAVTGTFTDTVIHSTDLLVTPSTEGQNPLFIVLDSGGHTVKLDQLHGSGFYDGATAITSDKIGNLYIGGRVEANITGGSLTPYVSNGGNTDYFIMKYGYDCACLSAPPPAANYTHTITTTGAYTVAFTYTGSTGYDSLRWNFGDGGTSTLTTPTHTYAGTGTYTACVTVYTACGSNTYCNTISFSIGVQQPSAGNIQVYPNPTRDELIVSGLANSATYRLMSITGATIKQGTIQNNNGISLSECTPGMYIVELLQSDGTKNVVRVVKE
jgi:PKD repeat protein